MPKVKEKKSFPCESCGITLSSPYNLKIHQKTKCSTEKNFICEVCDSRFLTQHSLRTHLNSLHFGEKKFICGFCGNKYLSKGQLKVHERSHTKEKSFVCQTCGKGFSHRESLVTHSTLHSGIKPYCCECCSATFSCVGNLIKHRKVRPNSCGLAIYTNKKINKRAGVKLASKAEIKSETDAPEAVHEQVEIPPVFIINENIEVMETEEVACESEMESSALKTTQVHIVDHQYVSLDLQQSTQMEDFSRKEMDVFDYIGIEIKNIQEQEEREKQLQLQNEAATDQLVEEFLIEEIAEESFVDQDDEPGTIVIERIDDIKIEEDDDDELRSFVDLVNGSFQCKLCPKMYQKKNITAMHLKSVHQIILRNYNYNGHNRYRRPQKNLNWKCRHCPKHYTSKKFVERHEVLHGPAGDLLHKCSCCQLYFETEEKMEEHQFAEHEDRLVCQRDGCEKRFDHPEKLIGHVRYAHSKKFTVKKYNFVCQLCGRNFNTRVALSDHERSNCGKTPIYQCSYCSRNYHSAGSLKCHLTIHTNALEFECSFCEKRFRTKGQLTVHVRSHTKEKNYKCSHCPAEFSHRESLLTHNTLHTGIKRFECSSCGSRFSCISNLLAHRKSHKESCGESAMNKVSDADNSVKMCKP